VRGSRSRAGSFGGALVIRDHFLTFSLIEPIEPLTEGPPLSRYLRCKSCAPAPCPPGSGDAPISSPPIVETIGVLFGPVLEVRLDGPICFRRRPSPSAFDVPTGWRRFGRAREAP
jgi:hypothetical protein